MKSSTFMMKMFLAPLKSLSSFQWQCGQFEHFVATKFPMDHSTSTTGFGGVFLSHLMHSAVQLFTFVLQLLLKFIVRPQHHLPHSPRTDLSESMFDHF